jgi:hypothetical protein
VLSAAGALSGSIVSWSWREVRSGVASSDCDAAVETAVGRSEASTARNEGDGVRRSGGGVEGGVVVPVSIAHATPFCVLMEPDDEASALIPQI